MNDDMQWSQCLIEVLAAMLDCCLSETITNMTYYDLVSTKTTHTHTHTTQTHLISEAEGDLARKVGKQVGNARAQHTGLLALERRRGRDRS
jgi:hypothetical protein